MTPIRPSILVPLALLGAALSTGCTVGPEYVTPKVATETAFATPISGTASATTGSAVDLERWWLVFDDPTLDRLVETALEGNLDVRRAAERVAEARAMRDWREGGRRPVASADGAVTERRQSAVGPLPIDRIPGLDRDQTIWDAGFDVSWEADLFGGTRRAVEASRARLEASAEELRGAAFSVAAEVARTYLEMRGEQRRQEAVEEAVETARRSLELAERRYDAGEAPRSEVVGATAELAALEARLPAIRAAVRSSALALGILLGAPPETELALVETRTEPAELAPFPVGERAELLARRPDVRIAERRLAAATAEIGVATAALYPRLSIGARGGFQALDPSDLPSSEALTWSVVPRISWRILDGGRVHAEIRIAEARARADALAWEKTVLGALTEAERTLTRYLGDLDAIELRSRALDAARERRSLANLRYEAGEAPLLELLDAQRATSAAEEALASARTGAAVDLVSLVKALGGGWSGKAPAGVSAGAPEATAVATPETGSKARELRAAH